MSPASAVRPSTAASSPSTRARAARAARAAGGDETLVRQLLFSTFHGGNGPSWAPRVADGGFATVHAELDDVVIEAE